MIVIAEKASISQQLILSMNNGLKYQTISRYTYLAVVSLQVWKKKYPKYQIITGQQTGSSCH
jgi:hypothetical protein